MKKTAILAAAVAAVSVIGGARAVSAAVVSDIYTGGTGTYTGVTGTVTGILDTYKNTNTFVIQDGTGSVIAYEINASTGSKYAPTVGDNITISTINDSNYQGSPELVNASIGTISVNSTGNAVTVPVISLPTFNGAGTGTAAVPPVAESIVTLDDVMIQGVGNSGTTGSAVLGSKVLYTISDMSGNTADLYTYTTYGDVSAAVSAANTASLTSGDTLYGGYVDITGYVDVFNGIPEIYPLSITSAGVPEPMSLGFVAVAAAGLLGRRRRTA